jgi:hypothetical protein
MVRSINAGLALTALAFTLGLQPPAHAQDATNTMTPISSRAPLNGLSWAN